MKHTRREFLGSSAALGAQLLGAGALGVGASACASTPTGCDRWKVNGGVWQDANRSNPGVNARYRVRPEKLRDLVEIVQCAEKERIGVRMTGAGHSYSDVAFSSGFMLSPERMGAALDVAEEQLSPVGRSKKLFRTEAGASIRSLNSEMDCAGLAFKNLGGYNAQSIVGAAMTATHGSGLNYGPVSSAIASIQVVASGGEVLQVEPRNGITDPRKFPGYIESHGDRIKARLVQDDVIFNAASVSLGAAGLVYAVVLEVEPSYWLKETPKVTTWGAVKCSDGFIGRLLSGRELAPVGPQPEYYEVSLNPYPAITGGGPETHQVLLQQRYKLQREPWRSAQDRKRGKLGTEVDALGTWASGKGKIIADTVNRWPNLAPGFVTESIKSRADISYINKSYEVFDIGPVNHMRVFGIEMSFDIKDTVRVAERFFELAQEHLDQGMVHTTPCTLRFVKQASSNLAMMHGRDTVTLEIGTILGIRRARDMLLHYEHAFMQEFGARPHWGLDLNVLKSVDDVKALWGDANVEQWLGVYRELNRSGVFNAAVTDRLGISVPRS
ncbi:MAG: FAD-binding protein [Polyangiaceae bacterium]